MTPSSRPPEAAARRPDGSFPSLHIRPPQGWLNDPNGLAYVDGVYHVFFQYNPTSARHHRIHWGHASSPDLVRWTDEPVALTPREGHRDSFGCWTGCVTLDHGVPTAVYSGLVADGGESWVFLARSDRSLREWVQEDEPVAGLPDEQVVAMRDPFVLEVEGRRWAIQGAGLADGHAAVVAHSCDDLHAWDYRGVVVSADHPVAAAVAPGVIWECPQLVRVDGTWVLVVSPLVGEPPSLRFDRVAWLAGDLAVVDGALRFEPRNGGRLDVGADWYAPQALVAGERVLVWGWSWEHGRSQEEVDAAGWAGVLTFPRELHMVDGVLVALPAPEVARLRHQVLAEHDVGPADQGWSSRVTGPAFEVVLSAGSGPVVVGLSLDLVGSEGSVAEASDERTGIDAPSPGPPRPTPGRRPVIDLPVPSAAAARVLVDGSLVEVFVDGEPARTSRAYPVRGEEWTVTVAPSPGPARETGDGGDGQADAGGSPRPRLARSRTVVVWTLGPPARGA